MDKRYETLTAIVLLALVMQFLFLMYSDYMATSAFLSKVTGDLDSRAFVVPPAGLSFAEPGGSRAAAKEDIEVRVVFGDSFLSSNLRKAKVYVRDLVPYTVFEGTVGISTVDRFGQPLTTEYLKTSPVIDSAAGWTEATCWLEVSPEGGVAYFVDGKITHLGAVAPDATE